MNASTSDRQKLIETINTLPDEALVELTSFIDYLCYKSNRSKPVENSSSAFLLSIAGLGASEAQDVSERDEEILQTELDPIQGWHYKPELST